MTRHARVMHWLEDFFGALAREPEGAPKTLSKLIARSREIAEETEQREEREEDKDERDRDVWQVLDRLLEEDDRLRQFPRGKGRRWDKEERDRDVWQILHQVVVRARALRGPVDKEERDRDVWQILSRLADAEDETWAAVVALLHQEDFRRQRSA